MTDNEINTEEVCFSDSNGTAETFKAEVTCVVCGTMDSGCDECGKNWNLGDKIVCHEWINYGPDGGEGDGEHVHLVCWHSRKLDGGKWAIKEEVHIEKIK